VINRREIIAMLGGAAVSWSLPAMAQGASRLPLIGILMGLAEDEPGSQAEARALREGLRELGWVDGTTARIAWRWSGGDRDRADSAARDLVRLGPDVIVAHSTPATAALAHQTSTIPIVFLQIPDPVENGFISSLARPDHNLTGLTSYQPNIASKWLDLLKEIAPGIKRVTIAFNPQTAPASQKYADSLRAAAPAFSVEPIVLLIHDTSGIERGIASMGNETGAGLIVPPDIFMGTHRDVIIRAANGAGVPAIYPYRPFAAEGGLATYGIDIIDQFHRASTYVDRILRGTAPADLPVQAPTKFELVINLKTAKALGLTIPPTLLARADEVIE